MKLKKDQAEHPIMSTKAIVATLFAVGFENFTNR